MIRIFSLRHPRSSPIMANHLKLLILVSFLHLCTTSGVISGGGVIKYDSTENCTLHIKSSDDILLKCNLNVDILNFTASTEPVTSLQIQCISDEILHNNNNRSVLLQDQTFSHFNRLRELTLLHCKLIKLPSNALYGLSELRNFTIQSYHSNNNNNVGLEIEPLSFVKVKLLEKLDLSFNNIKNIPESLFCPLRNLVTLNLSHNKLQDLKDLGLQSLDEDKEGGNNNSAVKKSCNLNLQILDLSYNNFKTIPSKAFSGLRRLHVLKLHNNDIKLISDHGLYGLPVLRTFDVSNNNLVALSAQLFHDCGDIREIFLQNNSLVTLTTGLFSKLEQLLSLDLSRNQLTSASLDSTTFSGLIRLVALNLSYNRITILHPYFFKDLYTLQNLNLANNVLESFPTDTFSPMNNLHTLILSYNRLATLEADSFHGLFAMSLLSLDNNLLRNLHKDSLRNCSALQTLYLNGNLLSNVPTALQNMRLLRTVDLGENNIDQLDEPNFAGMNNLNGLRLIGNEIKFISNKAFSELSNLEILNLSRNKIKKIEPRAFNMNKKLKAMRLDANLLSDISGLFNNISTLLWLNISDNKLIKFNYNLIPLNLQWLDLHKNKIKEIGIGNMKHLNTKLKLESIDLSFNLLTRLTPNSFPASITLILLNDNQINTIDLNTFDGKPNLTRVDLYANQILKMDLNGLKLIPFPENKSLPEFYIGGNPFRCDCTMEWLQRINTLSHLRQYPKVMDTDNIYCKLPYGRETTYIPLNEAEPSHFVCEYSTHCFALCHCCDFDACDCEMTCPTNCTCYHDQSWSAANIVDCSSGNYKKLPIRIPMDATEVYLDGNEFGALTVHSFIGRKKLRTLFMNDSRIDTIHNNTFNGLKKLQVIHLENNYLMELRGFELQWLVEIREIYLQNNRLIYIDNRTFNDHKLLEVLRLDGNRLHLFPVWHLTATNPYITRIQLANNNWSCHCQYLRDFRAWLRANLAKVTDSSLITCVLRSQQSGEETNHHKQQLGPHMADFNSSACSSYLLGYLDSDYNAYSKDHVFMLLAVVTAFIIAISLIFTLAYHRRRLSTWVCGKCSVKKCFACKKHQSAIALEENDLDKTRPFDAYVTYSVKDEGFVTQMLIPRMETQYRLKLHHRDFSMCSYVADTILEGVESSHRTIVILSTNFLSTEWCRFEFKSAFREALQRDVKYYNRQDQQNNIKRLIIIIFGDLPARDLDPDLRVYLNKTAICIKWGDSRFWEKLRFAMPSPTLTMATATTTTVTSSTTVNSTGNHFNTSKLHQGSRDTLKGSLYYCCQPTEGSSSASSGGRPPPGPTSSHPPPPRSGGPVVPASPTDSGDYVFPGLLPLPDCLTTEQQQPLKPRGSSSARSASRGNTTNNSTSRHPPQPPPMTHKHAENSRGTVWA